MSITDRINEEIVLLRARYPNLEWRAEGNWVRVPAYPLPAGWNCTQTDVVFQIVAPPAAPYGLYVPAGITFQGRRPNNYNDPVTNVPFPGQWGQFSWQPVEGEWRPGSTASSGSNYVNWVIGFADRFGEGA